MSIWPRISSATVAHTTWTHGTKDNRDKSSVELQIIKHQAVKKPKPQDSEASVLRAEACPFLLTIFPPCWQLLYSLGFFPQSNQPLYLVKWAAFSKRETCPWTHASISQFLQPRLTEQALRFPAGARAGTRVHCPVFHTIPAHPWVHHSSPSLVELSRFRSLQYNCLCMAHVVSLKKGLIIIILEPQ